MLKEFFRVFLFTVLVVLLLSANAAAQFAGGSGTAEDPWQIESPAQLLNIDDHLDGHFIQTGHIDMAGISFTAIGSPSRPFTGYYDGGHYEIRNMAISEPEMDEQALFRVAENAVFRNMVFTDASVEGDRRVGILVGIAEDTVFENISVSGEVISHGTRSMNWSYSGGMAGQISKSFVRHCFADVVVTGGRTVGGLVGDFFSSEMYQSASYGQVSGIGSNTGGLIGNSGGTSAITDSYSHAHVEGENLVGGLIGNFTWGRIQNCLSTGQVSGTGDEVGGLLGSVFSARRMNISHCFWNISASGDIGSAGGDGVTGLYASQLMQRETYDGFNFHSLWQIDEGRSYPSFQDLSAYDIPEPASLDDLQGAGTADDPWLLSSPSELLAMAQDVHGHYRLTADIDLKSSVIWNHGRGWTPLAGTDEGERFTGVLDGDGYRITGMVINAPMRDHTGIIRYAEDAFIKDLILEELYVIGSDYIGGIMGEGESVVLEKIQLSGRIRSAGDRWSQAGGIAGRVEKSMFHHVLANVTVAGTRRIGGLAGDFIDSEMYQSASYGHVWADVSNAGGLIGNSGGTSAITDSYSHADVEGENLVGGLIGNFTWGDILNTYSIGQVTGTGDDVGGLIGGIFSASPENSYWNTQTSGQMQSAGGDGVMGRNTKEMTWPHDDNTYQGWDFAAVWAADTSYIVNSGYPYLVWQPAPEFGSLKVTIFPQEAVNAGMQWRRQGTLKWLNSGDIELNVPVGQYIIEFKPVEGYLRPATLEVSVEQGENSIDWDYSETGSTLPGVMMLLLDDE